MTSAPSVARQLLLAVAVPLILFFGLTWFGLDILYHQLMERSLDDVLDQELVSLVSAAESNADGSIGVRLLDPESRLVNPGSGHYAQISDAHGQAVWSSPSLLGVALQLGAPLLSGARGSGRLAVADGTEVQYLRRGLRWEEAPGRSRDLVFAVAESTAPFGVQQRRFRQAMTGWFTLATLALLTVVGMLLRRVLRPIRRLEAEIGAIEAGQLDQLSSGYPRELAGTASNLNTLLLSERRRITRFRDTLGNLAHELKTPLAVARQALRSEPAPQASVNREIDRMAAIIDRQLTRATTSGTVTLGQAALDVAPIAAELRSSLLRVHVSKDLSIELQLQPGAGFLGESADLTELLGNLLDNACKWCRGRVRLRAGLRPSSRTATVLVLQIEDDGPGVPLADRERVMTRGVRTDERMPGHGLGLAIVRDTVAAYNGTLSIGASAELGGASFEVLLPGREIAVASDA